MRLLKRKIDDLKRQLQIRGNEVANVETLKHEVYHLQRELLLLSYQPGAKLHEIAARAGRSAEGHYKAVQRLRARLLQCIEGELKRDTA